MHALAAEEAPTRGNSRWTITPLLVGVFTSFETSFFLQLTDPGKKIKAPCIAWLVRNDAGAVVVMDTGPHPGDAPTAYLHNALEVNPDHRIDRALGKAGVDPREVETVVLSHLHFDHCYHLEHLPKARILRVSGSGLASLRVLPGATQLTQML